MPRPKKIDKGGRPSKYKPEYNEQAKKLCLMGYTDQQLADFFEVNVDTIYEWKKVKPGFSDALKNGKDLADYNVVDSLYNKAIGYEHDDEEIKVVPLGSGEGSEIQRVKIRKIYPPDTTAAIFWLKNRQPDKWRDKQDIDHTTNGKDLPGNSIDLSRLSDSALQELADAGNNTE